MLGSCSIILHSYWVLQRQQHACCTWYCKSGTETSSHLIQPVLADRHTYCTDAGLVPIILAIHRLSVHCNSICTYQHCFDFDVPSALQHPETELLCKRDCLDCHCYYSASVIVNYAGLSQSCVGPGFHPICKCMVCHNTLCWCDTFC